MVAHRILPAASNLRTLRASSNVSRRSLSLLKKGRMSNALYGAAMNWIGDGKDGASFEVQDVNVLSVLGGEPGTPFNIRLDLETALPDFYFQVFIDEMTDSLSVGIVTPSEFQPGWKTKGMFYNGNLTNGSAALAVSWGPRFGIGDSVGVRVITSSENVEVTFYKNGKSLGAGFIIENVAAQPYCPCLSVDGDAKLKIEIPEELPPQELFVEDDIALPGPWKLVEAHTEKGARLSMPGCPATLELSRDQTTVNFAFKVGNPIDGSARILADAGSSLTIKMGPMMSGQMMVPPALREIESLICGLNANLLRLGNGRLTLRNGPKRTVWERNPRDPLALPSYYTSSLQGVGKSPLRGPLSCGGTISDYHQSI